MRAEENPYPADSDEYYVHETLQLAHGGLGWASPNPLVGCLLVREGVVIGRAWHQRDGEQHAEVRALREAGDARGATCYVNLEPCSHVGRQPSCCHELAAAGVQRVVYGCADADSRTAEHARVLLPQLGLEVRAGVLHEPCAEFLDYYLHGHRRRRPFIHLKLALSLDGKLACPGGQSQWLSGPESLGYAHYLRQKYDGLLIGYRTVLADDPRLTARPEAMAPYRPLESTYGQRNPVPVILDPGFTLLPNLDGLRLWEAREGFREHLPRLIIAGREDALPSAAPGPAGLVLLGLSGGVEQPHSLPELAEKLWELGLRSVLVEGGAGLARELLRQRAVDKLSLVFAPRIIGADGLGFTPELACQRIADCPRLTFVTIAALGTDAVVSGYPVWDPAAETPDA